MPSCRNCAILALNRHCRYSRYNDKTGHKNSAICPPCPQFSRSKQTPCGPNFLQIYKRQPYSSARHRFTPFPIWWFESWNLSTWLCNMTYALLLLHLWTIGHVGNTFFDLKVWIRYVICTPFISTIIMVVEYAFFIIESFNFGSNVLEDMSIWCPVSWKFTCFWEIR